MARPRPARRAVHPERLPWQAVEGPGRRVFWVRGRARRRTRDNADRASANWRRPVRGCPNQTGVAVRLSLRTTDGKSHETVHSALWQRAATERTRFPPFRPWGHTPGCCRRRRSCPLRCPSAVVALANKRAPAVKRRRKVERKPTTAPVAGEHITDMVCFAKGCVPDANLFHSRRPARDAGPRFTSRQSTTLQGSPAPCQARGDGGFGVVKWTLEKSA